MAALENEREGVVEDAWNKTVPPFTKEDNPHGLVAESSFSVRFPSYREVYLKSVWPLVTKVLSTHGVKADLDLVAGNMEVVTTRKTWDPYIIIKSRDLIKLLARSMPFEKAVKVLEEDVVGEVIKIDGMVSNQDRFVKRRQRIVGPDDTTIKALELLTDCSIHVQGSTVAVVGSHRGVNQVRKVVLDTMKNVHPIYNIKAMMIKRELSKDEDLKSENWNRFLPTYESKRVGGRKKPKKLKKKKEYTPFPPPQLERKVDKEMASGEYFLKEGERHAKRMAERRTKGQQTKEVQQQKRNKAFVAPHEPAPTTSNTTTPTTSTKKRKRQAVDSTAVDLEEFKKKIKKSQKKKIGAPVGGNKK